MASSGARASLPLADLVWLSNTEKQSEMPRPEYRATNGEDVRSLRWLGGLDLAVVRELNTSPNYGKVRYSYLVEIRRESES